MGLAAEEPESAEHGVAEATDDPKPSGDLEAELAGSEIEEGPGDHHTEEPEQPEPSAGVEELAVHGDTVIRG